VLDTTRRASSCGAETLRSGDDGAGDSVEVRDRAGRFVGDDSVAGKSPRGCCRVATILEFGISVRSMRGYPNNKTGATRNSGQVLLGRKLGVDWGSEWGSSGRSGCLAFPVIARRSDYVIISPMKLQGTHLRHITTHQHSLPSFPAFPSKSISGYTCSTCSLYVSIS